MDKKYVQKKVLKDGLPLALDKFTWEEEARVFISKEDGLVIDFVGLSDCTFNTGADCAFKTYSSCTFNTSYNCTFNTGAYCKFKTGYGCTFNTGSDCTFNTSYDCTFNTGSDCTFKTGYGCTFDTSERCVVVRTDFFEVIKPKGVMKLCPYNIPGYIELIDDKWYLNGDKLKGEHIIIDGILSKVVSKKGNIYKVVNYGETKKTYLMTNGHEWAHGNTITKARESLIYKISDRDKSEYEGMTLETEYSFEEAIKMYRVITGACESGVRSFVAGKEILDKYSVKEILELTAGQFGNDCLSKFIRE